MSCGLDEAGRGCLYGDVVATAVYVKDNKKPEKKKISNLDDLLKTTPINTKNDNQIILDRLNKLEDIMFVIIEKLNKIDSKF